MSAIYVLAFLFVVPSDPARRNTVEFTKDSLDVVKQNVAKDKAVLVDVRSQEEWNQGYIDGSIFLPVTELRKSGDAKADAAVAKAGAKALAKKLPQKKILYTFCVVGMRARIAAFELEKQGYTVRALRPGYEDLVKAGFKKTVPKPPTKDQTARGPKAS
jgi:phage shock protein E